jgi:glutamyl-tRNA(Gln) amidotransferase subunit D
VSGADPLKGYKGRARARLAAFGVRVWSDVRAVNDAGSVFEGVVLPRSETLDDEHVVLKLKTGYNVGVHVDRLVSMVELGYKEAVYRIPEKAFPVREDLPRVTLLGTGGTIASRLDYRTGAVIPAFTPGELYGAVPELADLANLKTRKLFGVFSENMAKEQYVALAEAVAAEIESGVDGVVIGHGTDTMGHTAAILSFMVQDPAVPVVMVGSQRSSDRPSSAGRCTAPTGRRSRRSAAPPSPRWGKASPTSRRTTVGGTPGARCGWTPRTRTAPRSSTTTPA